MKKYFTIILLLISIPLFSQVTENFSDGDFTNNPAWAGDITSWQVTNGQLNSKDTVANSTFYLATPSAIASDAQWEIYVNLKFSTSSANYVDIYLISDVQDLEGNGNGYFIRIGNTSDEISLYKKTAGTATEIIDGLDDRAEVNSSDNMIKIKVKRTASFLWILYDDVTGTGSNYFAEGSITDAAFNSSSYFGISVKQSTPSFFGLHFIDDIAVGNLIPDVVPPAISNILVNSSNQLDVTFNEIVEQVSAETLSNYSVSPGIGNPVSATRDASNQNLVHLSFANSFQEGSTYTLSVIGIEDLFNNAITNPVTMQLSYFTPAPSDIVINEIKFELNSDFGTPDAEFVELYNRSGKTLNLNGWVITDGTTSGTATFGGVAMAPGSYLIVCSTADALLCAPFGTVSGLVSFPSLNDNDGDDLRLLDKNNSLIDEVIFNDSYYHNSQKNTGGWSIERIDPDFTCPNSLNWKAAEDISGGTPGKVNSVKNIFSDSESPRLVRAFISGSDKVVAVFSEPMINSQLLNAANYTIDNGSGIPVNVTVINSAKVELTVSSAFQPSVIYSLKVNESLADCPGNLISKSTARFSIPDTADVSDILINEVLYAPTDSGAEFIEIYNRSEKVIDLFSLRLSEVNLADNTLVLPLTIFSESILVFPDDYFVLTSDPDAVRNSYNTPNPDNIIAMSSFPSLNDDGDAAAIVNLASVRIDQFNYSPDFQFPLLNDDRGVSLERISFNRPTQDSSNWHSAAATVGFATPAYENSQHAEVIDDGSEVSVEPGIFSPDNDGNNDVVSINYHFGEPGYTANLKIFDSKGREIIHLVKNELLGTSGSFSWDGITKENQKAKVGIYVAYLEVFNEKGTVKKFKKPIVLASKL